MANQGHLTDEALIALENLAQRVREELRLAGLPIVPKGARIATGVEVEIDTSDD